MDEDWDTTVSSPVKTAGCTGTDFGRGRGFLPTLLKEKLKPGGLSDAVDDRKEDAAGTDSFSRSETEFVGRGRRGGFSNGSSRSYRSNKFRDESGEDRNANFEDTDFGGSGRGDGSSQSRGRGRGGPRGGRGNNRGRRFDDDNGNDNGVDFDGGNRRGGRGRGRGGGPRGGRSGSNIDEDGDGEEASESKPRELYIPPEPEDDEEKMFNSGISSGINFDKYDNINVKVTGEGIPRPIEAFHASGLRSFVLDNVKKCGYMKPTPVQKHAIPIVMDGRDLMACAQTGSGKTAAFLLPIINVLLSDPKDLIVTSEHCEPHAIVMSPTRELALQIFTEARKFAHGSIIKTVVTYGGTAAYHQAQQVMRGCHILVATPGRLNDFVGRGRIKFSSVRFFILDEADRMLDMGFLPDIERMMDHETMVPKEERQTLMFSATFPEEIQRLAGRFLNNYLFLAVGIVGGACSDVEQNFYQVSKFQKRNKLTELLNEGQDKALVFVETKRNADFIAAYLSERDYPTTSIHGDRLQRERELALQDFKSGRMNILVATAVAARGLDIKNVAHVINYDMPNSIDEYVHRIGRTGRVGNRGRATSFYDSDSDSALAKDLVKILKQAGQEIPSWLEDEAANSSGISSSKSSNFGGRDFRKFDTENAYGGGGSSNNDTQCNEPDEEW